MIVVCACDFDRPEFYNKERRHARKQYKCCECGGTIEKGDEYENVVGKWEGVIDSFKTCEKCADLWEAFSDLGVCPEHGGLEQYYRDYIEENGLSWYDEERDVYVYPKNHLTKHWT